MVQKIKTDTVLNDEMSEIELDLFAFGSTGESLSSYLTAVV